MHFLQQLKLFVENDSVLKKSKNIRYKKWILHIVRSNYPLSGLCRYLKIFFIESLMVFWSVVQKPCSSFSSKNKKPKKIIQIERSIHCSHMFYVKEAALSSKDVPNLLFSFPYVPSPSDPHQKRGGKPSFEEKNCFWNYETGKKQCTRKE